MITVQRGEGASDAVRTLGSHSGAVVLRAGVSSRTAAWGALRSFIAQGRAALGNARVERALAPRRTMLSIALRGLEPSLNAEERRSRGEAGGLAVGALPSPFLRDAGMYQAWQSAIGDLFAGERVLILVPELDAIDLESLQAFRLIVRGLRDRADVHVVLGHEPGRAPADPVGAFFRAPGGFSCPS